MLLSVLAVGCLALAALPFLLYLGNRAHFLPPPAAGEREAVSVLIPARNEEHAIGPAVRSVLASTDVDLEVIVLDDHSTDGTAGVVESLAKEDPRVRLEQAPALPAGWCGKQHACFTLVAHARFPLLTFLDADVRLTPDALARLAAFRRQANADLVSGFPRQETGTLLEKLVIPLINYLIAAYLPVKRMRQSNQVGLGAGCGQWFLTTRTAYDAVGGHSAVRASLHDGVKLPRAYRAAGFRTDLCDASNIAACRMYRSAGQVWHGLAKNAREGLGGPVLIWVWTGLLVGGHVLPVALLPFAGWMEPWQLVVVLLAVALSVGVRLACAARFGGSWLGALLHPVGVAALVLIQWYATVRYWVGRPVGWKGRPHPTRVSATSTPWTNP